jgi:hypothetical protein
MLRQTAEDNIRWEIINVNCQQNIDRLLIKLPRSISISLRLASSYISSFFLHSRFSFFKLQPSLPYGQFFRCKISAFTQRLSYLYFSYAAHSHSFIFMNTRPSTTDGDKTIYLQVVHNRLLSTCHDH